MLPEDVKRAVEAVRLWLSKPPKVMASMYRGNARKSYADEARELAGSMTAIRAHLEAQEAEIARLREECASQQRLAIAEQITAEKAEALLREVVAVAVTQLFDTHRTDVEATFSVAELQSMLDLTEPLMAANARVESIYRKTWDITAHLQHQGKEG